ncbi:MAG: hypothetical protein ACTTHI_07790, partial [Prevotella sp.]
HKNNYTYLYYIKREKEKNVYDTRFTKNINYKPTPPYSTPFCNLLNTNKAAFTRKNYAITS